MTYACRLTLAIVVALVCTVTLSGASVPVLGWSSHPSAFPATADQFLQDASVVDVLGTHLQNACSTPGTILFFVKDQLSLDDLSASTSGFQNVRGLMRDAPSSFVVPTMREGAATGTSLAKALVSSCDSLSQTMLSADAALKQPFGVSDNTALFVITLPANGNSDALVKAIVAKAQADTRGAVTALLTADASSQIARQRRALQDLQAVGAMGGYIPLRTDQRPDTLFVYFTIPIFMGFGVGLILVFFILVGVNSLMGTQTMQTWPDPQVDKNLIVHEN